MGSDLSACPEKVCLLSRSPRFPVDSASCYLPDAVLLTDVLEPVRDVCSLRRATFFALSENLPEVTVFAYERLLQTSTVTTITKTTGTTTAATSPERFFLPFDGDPASTQRPSESAPPAHAATHLPELSCNVRSAGQTSAQILPD